MPSDRPHKKEAQQRNGEHDLDGDVGGAHASRLVRRNWPAMARVVASLHNPGAVHRRSRRR
jgi:hypothetical protein